MTKDQLRVSINNLKRNIQHNNKILQELEQQLDALTEFGSQCDWRIRAFESSMEMRKQKLRSLDGLSGSVRAASKYQAKMNELLTGTEHQTTISSIDALMGSVGEQKRRVQQDILNQESYIRSLKRKLDQMQYEYNSWEEEVSANGSE